MGFPAGKVFLPMSQLFLIQLTGSLQFVKTRFQAAEIILGIVLVVVRSIHIKLQDQILQVAFIGVILNKIPTINKEVWHLLPNLFIVSSNPCYS